MTAKGSTNRQDQSASSGSTGAAAERAAAPAAESDDAVRLKKRAELDALCARVVAGDVGAGDQLVRRFSPGLRRLLTQRCGGNQEIAEDLLQRTWLNTWNALRAGRYDPTRASFSTYLYTVATHVWLQHLRTTGRAAARMTGGDPDLFVQAASADLAHDAADVAGVSSAIHAVRAALRGEALEGQIVNTLSPEEREILRAIASGETDRGLAIALGLAPSTAHARKKSAMAKLRRMLAAIGIRSDGENTGSE